MQFTRYFFALIALLTAGQAWAWGNHSLPAYRAFEVMPEVSQAPAVVVEPLEQFLRAEEKTLEALLASQEAWAQSNLAHYPARPAALAFKADATRPDDARRLAFLTALRVSPTAKWALYYQPDPWAPDTQRSRLPHEAVNTLPRLANATQQFVRLQPGERISALAVLASACDEADYGLDINLWSDSPSEWGPAYGFGKLPFGNPALPYATQAPFHMGFYHESSVLYRAAPFLHRTFPLLRSYQFSTLAELAFRTGHPYWGWRFAGLSLHYLQDLTQPYHASLAPGDSTVRLISANVLAMLGLGSMKRDMIVLLSNRHLALEKYQTELLWTAAQKRQESAIEKALHLTTGDDQYPPWSERYVRNVVARQAQAAGPTLVSTLVASMPPLLVSDPAFDFGVNEAKHQLLSEVTQYNPNARAQLDDAIAALLGNFGAHSRNALRGILKSRSQP